MIYFFVKKRNSNGCTTSTSLCYYFTAIHELKFVPKYQSLPFYRRYFDDILDRWRRHADPKVDLLNCNNFQVDMNDYGILTWDPFHKIITVNFMDLTIFYDPVTKRTATKVYKKPENLYLIIPPRSTHAPGVLKGSIVGTLY